MPKNEQYQANHGGKPKVIRCDKCGRRQRSVGGWNVTMSRGVVVGNTCPTCQTPEENAEAEINQATLEYREGPFGRIFARPKIGADQ